ncbi:MAG: hypothetical protein K8M05_36040 [Deltaproteobacteria bacterium]|nr:hypothetical protein [Kofleriaceae bacterium]
MSIRFPAPGAGAGRAASALHPDRVLAREVLVIMRGFTDEACACADHACVSGVQARMAEWAAPRLPRIQELTPTAEENEAAEALQVRMQGCLARLAPPVMPLTGAVVLGQLRGFKDDICACRDKACVAGVQERMLAWAVENLEAMKGLEPTKAEGAEAELIDTELTACIERIDGATR